MKIKLVYSVLIGFGLILSGCVSSYHLYEGDRLPESERVELRIMIPQGMTRVCYIAKVDDRTRDGKDPPRTLWGYTDVIYLDPGVHKVQVKILWWRDIGSLGQALSENTGEEDTKVTTINEISHNFLIGHSYVIQLYECKKGATIRENDLKIMTVNELASLKGAGIGVGSVGGAILFWTWPLIIAYEVVTPDGEPESTPITQRYIWMTDESTGEVVWGDRPQVRDGIDTQK